MRRRGDRAHRERVEHLLRQGEAAWCPVVRLELWRGAGNDAERKALRRYEAIVPDYPITEGVWTTAIALASRARAAGLTAPLADLIVFACARVHALALAHDDEHFASLERLDARAAG